MAKPIDYRLAALNPNVVYESTRADTVDHEAMMKKAIASMKPESLPPSLRVRRRSAPGERWSKRPPALGKGAR